jgi:hypothetical protein
LFLQENFAGEIDTKADIVDNAIKILGRTPRKLTAEEEANSVLAKTEPANAEPEYKDPSQLSAAEVGNEPEASAEGTDSPNQASEAAAPV